MKVNFILILKALFNYFFKVLYCVQVYIGQ